MNKGIPPDIDLAALDDRQLDGLACCRCGEETGPMVPLYNVVVGSTLFEHQAPCEPQR